MEHQQSSGLKAFTLIELIIVIVIIAILAVSAIPFYTNLESHARKAATIQNLIAIRGTLNLDRAQLIINAPLFGPDIDTSYGRAGKSIPINPITGKSTVSLEFGPPFPNPDITDLIDANLGWFNDNTDLSTSLVWPAIKPGDELNPVFQDIVNW